MNEEIKLEDGKNISSTNLAWTVKKAELFGAIMAFSRRQNSNVHGLLETKKFWSTNKSKPDNHENLSLFCKSLGIESSGIITCRQVHGDRILICKEVPKKIVAADAIIATTPGLYPLIRTADCVPILIIDRVKKISAAIHAGWKGTVLRIIRKTLSTLTDIFKCDKSDIIVALGPSIGKCCYEVDRVVLDPLFQNLPWATEFAVPCQDISASNDIKKRLDLGAINQSELIKFGIYKKNIYKLNMCTSCNVSDLHSFRRDGASSGRSIAITGFRS
ncbi:MAG: purine-nucleoside/S-methyl-5-thioadenosine phosphorylase / adenosine deaminase [Thermodesulfobacteriota bacterium]|nr:purine-nucleoside/S-methyl-5-thioadenosine phosphorylase / adenosine deaminase [Thermodesulfobacteriota bacterium]